MSTVPALLRLCGEGKKLYRDWENYPIADGKPTGGQASALWESLIIHVASCPICHTL